MFVFMIIKNIYNYKILLVLAYNYKPSHNNVFWFWHIEYKLLLNNKIVTINEYSIQSIYDLQIWRNFIPNLGEDNQTYSEYNQEIIQERVRCSVQIWN